MYVEEAYKVRKWAFVSDYARLWIIYNYGGIYLDTDVELIKSLDTLLNLPAFFGYEDKESVATGLGFGAQRGNKLVECMLKDYENIHFINKDGTYDMLPCPIRNTKAISSYLPKYLEEGKVINLENGTIYPPEYFCPVSADGKSISKTKNTYSIHWFNATWLSEEEKVVHQWRLLKNRCERIFGEKLGGYIARGIYLLFPKRRAILKRM